MKTHLPRRGSSKVQYFYLKKELLSNLQFLCFTCSNIMTSRSTQVCAWRGMSLESFPDHDMRAKQVNCNLLKMKRFRTTDLLWVPVRFQNRSILELKLQWRWLCDDDRTIPSSKWITRLNRVLILFYRNWHFSFSFFAIVNARLWNGLELDWSAVQRVHSVHPGHPKQTNRRRRIFEINYYVKISQHSFSFVFITSSGETRSRQCQHFGRYIDCTLKIPNSIEEHCRYIYRYSTSQQSTSAYQTHKSQQQEQQTTAWNSLQIIPSSLQHVQFRDCCMQCTSLSHSVPCSKCQVNQFCSVLFTMMLEVLFLDCEMCNNCNDCIVHQIVYNV